MRLVPTLEKMVGEIVAQDFWANHQKNQLVLDAQNEGDFSALMRLAQFWAKEQG